MASKRRLRRKQCGDKVKFATSKEAENAAKFRSKDSKAWIASYKCQFCGFYHIGHPPKNVRMSIMARLENGK